MVQYLSEKYEVLDATSNTEIVTNKQTKKKNLAVSAGFSIGIPVSVITVLSLIIFE
jgi:hypothetical protein